MYFDGFPRERGAPPVPFLPEKRLVGVGLGRAPDDRVARQGARAHLPRRAPLLIDRKEKEKGNKNWFVSTKNVCLLQIGCERDLFFLLIIIYISWCFFPLFLLLVDCRWERFIRPGSRGNSQMPAIRVSVGMSLQVRSACVSIKSVEKAKEYDRRVNCYVYV